MMKNLFKKREEDIIDIQTLSTVSHQELCQIVIKFHAELKEAGQKLESQSESLKALKNANDELSLYKTHSESLQGCIQQMSIENESYKTIIESRNHEQKYYKEKVAELEKICENAKNVPSILAELEIFKAKAKEAQEKNASLTAEKEFHVKQIAHYESEQKLLEKRQEDYQKRVNDTENALKVKTDEYFKVKQDNKNLKVKIKEKEAEVKDLDAVNKGKAHRIQELETQVNSLVLSQENLKKLLEESEGKIEDLTENLKNEKTNKDSVISEMKEKLEKETSEKLQNLSQNLLKSIEDYKIKITTLEIEKSSNFSQIQKLTQDLESLEKQLKTTQDSLETSQKKRNLAKEELLKLTQKLESVSHDRAPVKPLHNFVSVNVSTSSLPEHKAVGVIKSQLDTLYKSLMDLMLSANTTRDAVSKSILYHIGAEDFSKFEKDLNKIVMNAHEAAENPVFVEQGSGWAGRFSNWAPSKFFSCMSNDRQADRSTTSNAPEKRRSSYKGFF
jgi:chromosome segregation ATPase